MRNLFHPKFMATVAQDHFPNTCKIQNPTIAYDESNEQVKVWVDDSELKDLKAYIEPIDATQELRKADQTIVMNGYMITLADAYDIAEGQRIVDESSNAYDILSASIDAFNTHTNLTCEIVNSAINNQDDG